MNAGGRLLIMELGIRGRRAVLCGSSRGLGFACAQALAAEGVDVVINGRDADRLEVAATKLAENISSRVIPVVGDVTTEEGRYGARKHFL